jgi:disulfide bond formation protein DsbB
VIKFWFARAERWLGLLLALTLLLLAAGFVLEYGFRILPCEMCWWQRYAQMAIAAFAAAGLLSGHPRWRQVCAGGAAGAALFGLGVAAWQFAAQQGWLPFPAQCSGSGVALADAAHMLEALQGPTVVPCDKENFRLLGLSLAGWNMPAMLLAASVALRGGWEAR